MAVSVLDSITGLIGGGIIGWLARTIPRTEAGQGTLLSVVVGSVGASVAGLVRTPSLGIGTINEGNEPSWIVSLLGALTLVAAGKAFRAGAVG